MKHRLTVEIEKRFKKQLSKRFNPGNARIRWGMKEINISCPLCDEYYNPYGYGEFCKRCPFYVYHNEFSREYGCLGWILRLMGERWTEIFTTGFDFIEWCKEDNKEAIELIKKLLEKAKKYIIWVEDAE